MGYQTFLGGARGSHRRHWAALAELSEEGREEAERQKNLEEQFADIDFKEENRPELENCTLRKLSEKPGLSTGYLGEIRRGETVPCLEHWAVLRDL